MCLIWPKWKFQKLVSFYRSENAVNNNQYVSRFWFLKLTKQINFKFCFCLILCYKAFLTVLVNVYCFDVVIHNEHIPRYIPLL